MIIQQYSNTAIQQGDNMTDKNNCSPLTELLPQNQTEKLRFNFRISVLTIDELLTEIQGEPFYDKNETLLGMCYCHILSLLEAYFSDLFLVLVVENDASKEKLLLTAVGKKSWSKGNDDYLNITNYIHSEIGSTWSKLNEIEKIFKKYLFFSNKTKFNFCASLKGEHVIRNNIIHRAGKTKDMLPQNLTAEDIAKLYNKAILLVENTDKIVRDSGLILGDLLDCEKC